MSPSQAPDAPTTELGAPDRGLRSIGGAAGMFGGWRAVVPEREIQLDLRWPRSVKTYATMLNDAQVDGLYRGATLPIRAYDWCLNPNGAPPEMVAAAQAEYDLDLVGQDPQPRRRTQNRFIFDEHLEDALRFIASGHRFFEQVYDVRQDGPESLNGGWMAHLRKLADRPPVTISAITPAPDGGLRSIRVPALRNPSTDFFQPDVEITIDRLVAYIWDREGANWRGRSMLRSLYRPWKLKDRVMRVGAINIERAGGVPYVTAPEGAGQKDMEKLAALASAFRVGEEAGASLPHGATLNFAKAAGGDEAVNFVRLQNEEMARAWLMMFLQIGQTSTGHGSTQQAAQQIDYFALVQHAIAGAVAKIFSRHVIEDWVELNYGPGQLYAPLIEFTPRGNAFDDLAGELDNAQTEGALPADSPTAAAVRAAAGDRPRSRRTGPVRAAEVKLPSTPVRRDPNEAEVAAAVDFDMLETTLDDGIDGLIAEWSAVRAAQLEQVAEQVRAADGNLELLAAIVVDPAGGDILLARITQVAQDGIDSAMAEASRQGVVIDAPDVAELTDALEGRANATARLMANSLAEAVSRRAVALSGGTLTPDEVATGVVDYVNGLTDAFLRDQFNGLLTQAMATGRGTVMDVGGEQITAVYASALLDRNACAPCIEWDGHEFDDLAQAEGQFPTGGNMACLGGPRCRCTLVAVYDETPASV